MSRVEGRHVIVRSLKAQGVEHVFGVVGFPIMELAHLLQSEGIKFYGFRNEQAASYAAGAVGYLTGRPGVCATVSGPGMVHAIAGLSNAWANCWPMLLMGGAPDSYQREQGAFQEAPQLEAARPFVKLSTRPDSLARVPYYVEKCVRTAMYGRPGAVYLDLPNDLIAGSIAESDLVIPPCVVEAPRSLADPEAVTRALALLRGARRPLVIVGKGAAYARAEHEVRSFIDNSGLPFLASPMGKGVVADNHPQSVAPARSHALQEADVVFLIGARLNWMMHFGEPPRFARDVKFIQLDIAGDEISSNAPAAAALVGDAKVVMRQVNDALAAAPWSCATGTGWWQALRAITAENEAQVAALMNDDSVPMGYYRVLRELRDAMPKDAILASEGANTMDIGRSVLLHGEPRLRLDAGTFGTMGVGPAFAIAAAVVQSRRKVVCLEGDSAIGFSAMELETACRYKLPITFVVVNNNGIGGGEYELSDPVPPHMYTPSARYDRLVEAFGGRGYFATTPDEVKSGLRSALDASVPTLVNIMIDPKAGRKPQKFAWLTRKE